MRSHGVSDFPDPQVSTTAGSTSIRQAVPSSAASSPTFRSAQKACAAFQPGPQSGGPSGQGPGKAIFLAFARCLRAHGISNFPDPTASGRLSLQTIRADGVDLQSPGFFTAGRECLGVTHGEITVAQLREAISGPH